MEQTYYSVNASANYSSDLEHKRHEMRDAWIGFVIVSMVFSLIFPDPGFFGIINLILLIHAISKTVQYCDTKKNICHVQVNVQSPAADTSSPHYYEPQYAIFKEQPAPVERSEKAVEQPINVKYCPMCGYKQKPEARFCSACGSSMK